MTKDVVESSVPNGSAVTTKSNSSKPLSPQQRGAAITNSGKSPIASLPEDQRKALLDSVLDRAMQDEKLADIAASLGIAKTSLSQALLRHCEEDWKSVQLARALVALDSADEELDVAPAILAVTRARERLKSAQWKLERLHRRLFGTDQPVNAGGAVHIHIGIDRSPKQVIGQDGDNLLIEQDKAE